MDRADGARATLIAGISNQGGLFYIKQLASFAFPFNTLMCKNGPHSPKTIFPTFGLTLKQPA